DRRHTPTPGVARRRAGPARHGENRTGGPSLHERRASPPQGRGAAGHRDRLCVALDRSYGRSERRVANRASPAAAMPYREPPRRGFPHSGSPLHIIRVMADEIDALLREDRSFPPTDEFKKQANVNDPAVWAKALRGREAYWASWAQQLDWETKWNTILEWNPPYAKWFVGGKLNASYNCLDRHLATRGDKQAIIWEGEPGDVRTFTYRELHTEVSKFTNVLKSLGVTTGDRVAIYMPLIPEAIVAMLACARLGAVHSVVFGGFSSEALRDRIQDAQAKCLITATGGYRRGN